MEQLIFVGPFIPADFLTLHMTWRLQLRVYLKCTYRCAGGRLLFTVPALLVSIKRPATAEQFEQQSKPWPRLCLKKKNTKWLQGNYFPSMPGDGLSCFVKIILGWIQLCQLATDKQVLDFIDNCGSFTGTHVQAQEMEAEGSLDQPFWWKNMRRRSALWGGGCTNKRTSHSNTHFIIQHLVVVLLPADTPTKVLTLNAKLRLVFHTKKGLVISGEIIIFSFCLKAASCAIWL